MREIFYGYRGQTIEKSLPLTDKSGIFLDANGIVCDIKKLSSIEEGYEKLFQPHGHGRMLYVTGNSYEGDWSNGKNNGNIIISNNNNIIIIIICRKGNYALSKRFILYWRV